MMTMHPCLASLQLVQEAHTGNFFPWADRWSSCLYGPRVETACPMASQSVAAIHRSCPQLMQDVHVVSDSIMPLLQPLAAAGAARVRFHWEVLIKLRSIANRYPILKYLSIDGGVNAETFVKAAEAGANVFIAGSSIFWKNRIISDGRNGPLKSYRQLHTILMQHGLWILFL